jgi:hypothetical protein
MLLCLIQSHKRSANQNSLSVSAPIFVAVIYVCLSVCGRLDEIAVSKLWLRRACPSVGLHGAARLPLDGFSWWGTLHLCWLGILSVRLLEHQTSQCHTIITPRKCTLSLLKAPDITICTLSYILHLHVSTRVGHLQGAQCQCLAKVIINYNLLKLR